MHSSVDRMASSWTPFRWLSPGGRSAALQIFIFHRVLPEPDPLRPDEPDARQFREICAWLADWFHVLPLEQAVHRLRQGDLPSAAACITFDDGYADNLQVAQPVLAEFSLPATCFVSTGFLDGGRMWNDTIIESVRLLPEGEFSAPELGLRDLRIDGPASRHALSQEILRRWKHLPPGQRGELAQGLASTCGLPPQSTLMLTSEQLRLMHRRGMAIGGHTIHHPILAAVPETEAREEIGGGREVLRGLLGEAPALFAYPNGVPVRDYGARDIRLVREAGFKAAVSTAHGANRSSSDAFQLRRFTPWDRRRLKFGARCAFNVIRAERQPLVQE